MKIERFLIISVLFVVFLCGVGAISAASDNAMDNLTYEVDSIDESVSVENDEQVSVVDLAGSASNTQENKIDTQKVILENKLGSSNNGEVLKGEYYFNGTTFSELQTQIGSLQDGDVLYLTKDVKQYGDTEISIGKSITIDGQGYTMDAQGNSYVFNANCNSLTLNNITFINACDDSAVCIEGYGVVVNCSFINTTAGAVYITMGGIIGDCTFINNTDSTVQIYGSCIIGNCTFLNNAIIDWNAGAIYIADDGIVANCTFINNTADYYGGAVYISDGVVSNCTFINNTAVKEGGGAVFMAKGVVGNCTFINNAAGNGDGCAVFIADGAVSDSNFIDNTAGGIGSAVYSYYGLVVLDNNWWGNNVPDFNSLIGIGQVASVSLNNWIMANLTVDDSTAVVRLNLLNHTNGEITSYEGSLPARNVTYELLNGDVIVASAGTPVNISLGLGLAKVDNQIFSTIVPGTYTDLQWLINKTPEGGVLNLEYDFKYMPDIDGDNFKDGVIINKALIINGNNYIISGEKQRRIFNISAASVTLNNIIFADGYSSDNDGGAVYWNGAVNGTVSGCTFVNNTARNGGAVYIGDLIIGNVVISDSTFTDNDDENDCAIYNIGNLTLNNNKISNIIYNGGNITSELIATFLDGKTVNIDLGQSVVANATLTDVDGNSVYDSDFKINIDGVELTTNYDIANRTYYASEYVISNLYVNPVSSTYETEILTIINGFYKAYVNVTSFVVAVNDAQAGENVTGNVTLLGLNGEGLNETLWMIVNNNDFEVAIVNGTGTFNVEGLSSGQYSALAIFIGDIYNVAYASDVFTVFEPPVQLDIDVENIAYGDVAVINITFKTATGEDYNGMVLVNVSGREIGVNVVKGKGSAEFINLDVGTYIVNAIYYGDALHEPVEDSSSFGVVKASSEISISGPGVAQKGSDVEIKFSILPVGAIGNVTLWIDGVEFVTSEYDVSSGSFTIPASKLSAQTHNITVQFLGNDQFLASNNDSYVINITKLDVGDTISSEGSTVLQGEIATVNVEGLPKDATGNITVTIDGKTYNATVENGNAVVEIPGLTEGIYELFPVVYSGDDKYNEYIAMATIIVKTTPEVNITVPSGLKAGDDANITVSIPNATGNVSVIVDGVKNVVPLDENGTAVVPITDVAAGAHSIVVVYSGDELNAGVIATDTFTVGGEPVVVNATEIVDIIVENGYAVTAKLVDGNGTGIANAVINYTINGVPNTTTTAADGSFTIVGQNNCVIDIKYEGNETLSPTDTSITLNFTSTRLSTSIVGDTFTQYSIDYYAGERGGYFEVQLFDQSGKALADKPVKIGFNGKVYNSVTNSTGWAKLQINLRSAGSYTFAVGFLGDDDYTGSMEVYLIQVNKKPTSISASAASYKASDKTKKYTVSLSTKPCSSSDGKTYLASGKAMKLTIGGKTYTAKTDSNGKATFNIDLTKKGTYSATVNFAGDTSYVASSKTVKITLK